MAGAFRDQFVVDVFQAGAGTSFNILDFFLFSDHGMLVVLPEPTAIENAYRFIKSAFYRRFKKVVAHHKDVKEIIDTAMDQKNAAGLRTPHDLIERIKTMDQGIGEVLELGGYQVRDAGSANAATVTSRLAPIPSKEEPVPNPPVRGAMIFDGTGSPWVRGDVAVSGDRIDGVGSFPRARASARAP